MTITVGLWAFPLAMTMAMIAWAILMPLPSSGGSFDIGGLLSAIFRAFVVVVGTLLAWLVWALLR
ncbi:hypothetical protein [uncultured Methylobacterium sp.]|uniref:hypothetical protein n=1 Tax=uncultured Methylobacterium sp. TaxID=157278 RepID=UPI0035CC1C51